MTDLRKAAEMVLEVLDSEPELFVSWIGRIRESREALRQALAQPTWHCPLKKPDCNENCGSYGCGN